MNRTWQYGFAVYYLQQLILWDFLDERDDRWMYLDLEDIPFFSDSDDSDWSDYELSFD